jgi:hypothetical protein
MKNLRSLFICVVASLAVGCGRQEVTGGNCQYGSYSGTVTVREVQASSESRDDMTVKVEFEAAAPNAAPAGVRRFTKDVAIPRPKAEAMGLTAGRKYTASAIYITSGSCAPGPELSSPGEWR